MAPDSHSDRHSVYVGTFTGGGRGHGRGIHVLGADPVTGRLSPVETVLVSDPSFLAISSRRGFLYSASHVPEFEGSCGSGIVAWRIDPDSGRLSRLNHQVLPHAHAAYVSLAVADSVALVACTLGGAVAVLPIARDGTLGPATCLVPAGASFPHAILGDPGDRFVVVPDLSQDRVWTYPLNTSRSTLDEEGASFVAAAAGSGPRHPAFHPTLPVLYMVNQGDSTVTFYEYSVRPGSVSLRPAQSVSTLLGPCGAENLTAEIRVHPSGRFLYASNRGEDSITAFLIDPGTGSLEAIESVAAGGRHPRAFDLSPDGGLMLVANLESDNIVAFEVDPASGRLTRTGESISVASPTCVRWLNRARISRPGPGVRVGEPPSAR